MHFSVLMAAVGLSSLTYGQRLTKPVLESSLDYLQQGLLDNLGPVNHVVKEWHGWIPSECQKMATDNKFNSDDVSTYNVTYDDCSSPWFLCRHKDSQTSLANMTDLFGRLPVHMRQWVRHVVLLPADQTWAYNENGSIAIFDKVGGDLELFIHETGHSLDLLYAYPEKPLSSSSYWLTQYNLDNNTCDPYAQTNQVENVAQNTVVGTFNENVPNGYCGVEKNCGGNFHQYATLQTEADLAAPGKILHPGGVCTHRLANSPPVKQHTNGTSIKRRAFTVPDVSLPDHIKEIEPVSFSTKEHCKETWSKR